MSFDPKSIAVASSTYYPKWYTGKLRSLKHTDKVRGDLAIEFVNKTKKSGYSMVIVDGGSTKTFLKTIKIEGVNVLRIKNTNRFTKRLKGVYKASKIEGVKAIILTEPEKVSLIEDCIPQIVTPILVNGADLVVPKRDQKLFKETYPDYMYESEVEGNTLYNEELRAHDLLSTRHEDLDLFFGPRVFKNDKKLLNLLFRRYKSSSLKSVFSGLLFEVDDYSSGLFFPVVNALKREKKVVSVTVPFKYPRLQKENEAKGNRELFILKRKYQRLTVLIELMHFLGYLDRKKNARISPVAG